MSLEFVLSFSSLQFIIVLYSIRRKQRLEGECAVPVYIERFGLPIGSETAIMEHVAAGNGGMYGYIDNPYPCGIFPDKELHEVYFKPITIFYGGNGSGKSTLLNLIAKKAELKRIAPHNTGETFDLYVKRCKMDMGQDDEGDYYRVPNGSQIITSDDIFDYMLTMRTSNDEITESKADAREDYAAIKYGKTIQLRSLDNYEEFRLQVLARTKSVSRRQFIRRVAGSEVELASNGETALQYFEKRLKNDTLYCLDEPENSMSPRMQLNLVKMLEEMARYCGCQFIIATHSPFLLAMDGARIIDLDSKPAMIRNWWELENTRTYFEFFEKHRNLFVK